MEVEDAKEREKNDAQGRKEARRRKSLDLGMISCDAVVLGWS